MTRRVLLALVVATLAAMLLPVPVNRDTFRDAFSPVVSHPLFPLASLRHKVYVGEERDAETGATVRTRVEEALLPETAEVAGVEVAVVETREYENGELVELAHDYYAQHRDGTVYYFGERVNDYADGQIVGHEGAWLAGEGATRPGVVMPAHPVVGQTFEQEPAPGMAADPLTVIAVDQPVVTRAGQFGGCVRTEEVNPLDGTAEHTFYCPGVGVARVEFEGGFLNLVSFEGAAPV